MPLDQHFNGVILQFIKQFILQYACRIENYNAYYAGTEAIMHTTLNYTSTSLH